MWQWMFYGAMAVAALIAFIQFAGIAERASDRQEAERQQEK